MGDRWAAPPVGGCGVRPAVAPTGLEEGSGDPLVVPDEPAGGALAALADLKGRTLAAASVDAFGGYQILWAELRRLGLDPEQGQPRPVLTGFPMAKVVESVLNGDADAGVLRACLLEHLEQEGALRPGQLRVLSPRADMSRCRVSSRLYPGWAFAAARSTPPALSRDVLVALLSLSPDAAGQSWSVPADYHPVHELLQALQIGPYAFLRETAWPSLWERYWAWVCGLVAMLLAWGAYTLHVEHLVQRRTRELTQAMEARGGARRGGGAPRPPPGAGPRRPRAGGAGGAGLRVSETSWLLAGVPGVTLRQESAAAGLQVWVDPLQAQQVLLNLFKNAWNAQQAVGCDLPIEVSLSREGARCSVAVRDHGPGLSPELQARLFEAFFTTKPDGLGLGLSICKTIIEAHGGEIGAIEARPGPGLVIYFTLPLVDGAQAQPERVHDCLP
ncbi:MAG: PhnD/SsuA/transferrin family substrate-binding protein [Zoogloea sp.]|nr:PhnD/SsuA/transferrin family substrate-binding protein [Zoogloea sp.]